MTEADVITQMVEYQNILLMGVSVFFTIISAYLVAIWAFLRRASLNMRAFSFFFLSLIIAFLGRLGYGSALIHDGLVETLRQIAQTDGLSPAGLAALGNAASGANAMIQNSMFIAIIVVYIALFFLTFFARTTLKDA